MDFVPKSDSEIGTIFKLNLARPFTICGPSEMAKVFVVTEGCYSDYSIVAAFSTEAAADKFAALHPDYFMVEEFELDKSEYVDLTRPNFAVRMEKNGDVVEISVTDPTDEPDRPDNPCFRQSCARGGRFYAEPHGQYFLFVVVRAKDKQHAIKIVNERRARYIAENIWPEQEAE